MKTGIVFEPDLYYSLAMCTPIFDENGTIIGSYFSDKNPNIFRLADKDYIGLFFNRMDGIRNIELLLVQYSLFSPVSCINIANYVKRFSPQTKLVFVLKQDDYYAEYFCHRIVNEHLGYIVTHNESHAIPFDELFYLLNNNFNSIAIGRQYNYLIDPKTDLSVIINSIRHYDNSISRRKLRKLAKAIKFS